MRNKLPFRLARFVCLAALAVATFAATAAAQAMPDAPTSFRVGEKLTYTIDIGQYRDVGYAELQVLSRGRLEGRDAVELAARIKTRNIGSAAFFFLNEERVTFAAADSGLPLYVRRSPDAGVIPLATVRKNMSTPNPALDILSLIYRLRREPEIGTYTFEEAGRSYVVNTKSGGTGTVKTDTGEIETQIVQMESEYFTKLGLEGVCIEFKNDLNDRIPVQFMYLATASKNIVTIRLQSRTEMPQPTQTSSVVVTPTPTPTTPKPTPVPTPAPLPPNNLPLSPSLPFALGEFLEYRVSSGDREVGKLVLRAAERKYVGRRDSLFLTGSVTDAAGGNGLFSNGDSAVAVVDPETITPIQAEARFTGAPLAVLNTAVAFDQDRGLASVGGRQVPVTLNTHTLLSLLYAVRSFNLKPSKDEKDPVNDTRVSVFYGAQNYVFTLRPLQPEAITVNGAKVSAQRVVVITGIPELDQLAIKVWLSNDIRRLPLRITADGYQADLVNSGINAPGR